MTLFVYFFNCAYAIFYKTLFKWLDFFLIYGIEMGYVMYLMFVFFSIWYS